MPFSVVEMKERPGFRVEEEFRSARKGHPAFVVDDLDEVARCLEEAGGVVRWDDALAGRRRFYTEDPFGNRVELMEVE